MVSLTRSIFDGQPLADFVDALVERIEPRVDGAVVELEDVAAGKECEDPVMMLDITKNRLDGLADECDHAPHKFHCSFLPAGFVFARRSSPAQFSQSIRRPLPEPSMGPLRRVAGR
jgi:hypothetical protein